jgi:hypothetical protein
MFGYDTGTSVAHVLDITPFMVSLVLFVAAIVVSSRNTKVRVLDHELTELNRCDGCKATFHDFFGLTKVEGKGFLCEKCRSNPPEPPQSEAEAS